MATHHFQPEVFPPILGPGQPFKFGEMRGLTPSAIWFHDDFIAGLPCSETAGAAGSPPGAGWKLTLIDGGGDNGEIVGPIVDGVGGILKLTTNDADNDALEVQMAGSSFALASGRSMVFEIRMAIEDVSETDWFVGFAIGADTTILTGCTDFIGFGNTADAGDIMCVNGKNASGEVADGGSGTTLTDSGEEFGDSTATAATIISALKTLRVEIDGTTEARFYVDNKLVATHTTNLPDDEDLSPAICLRTAGAAAETLYADWLTVGMTR